MVLLRTDKYDYFLADQIPALPVLTLRLFHKMIITSHSRPSFVHSPPAGKWYHPDLLLYP